MWKEISEKDRDAFNALATHPLQAFEWGEFRKKTGVTVVRKGFFKEKKLTEIFQLTIHNIPHTNFTIGYLPKGVMPTKTLITELKNVGKQYNCIFIQLEPNVKNYQTAKHDMQKLSLTASAHPLFTKYTFLLDLTRSEDELLKNMHSKTRYNIRVAQKHNVTVTQETTQDAFNAYWKLTEETTTRQGFFSHTPSYHKKMWETLKFQISNSKSQMDSTIPNTKYQILDTNKLTAHLLIARLHNKPLTAWILFVFHDTLYYPYGASSSEHREAMASNLQMWEAIKFGKKLGLKQFDMWGSLGERPNPKDPWYGFHRFKQGYGPTLTEFVGSFDLIINPTLYFIYTIADKLRWLLLKLKR